MFGLDDIAMVIASQVAKTGVERLIGGSGQKPQGFGQMEGSLTDGLIEGHMQQAQQGMQPPQIQPQPLPQVQFRRPGQAY